MSENKTIVKSGKKVTPKEPTEKISKVSNTLQNEILAQFEKSKKAVLKTAKDFKADPLIIKSIQLLIETADMYLQITNNIKKSTKKGGRKKSVVRYNLAFDIILEYLSEQFKGALPRKIKRPTGLYLHNATNKKIAAYNKSNNTNHPFISERTANLWLKEFKETYLNSQ